MSGPEPFLSITPRDRAGFEVQGFVRRVAVEAFGAMALGEPIEGFEVLTRRALDDPLAGVRAALLVHEVAAGQMRRWALEARGAGRSWDDVAAALDLARTGDADSAQTAGEVAWMWLVEHRPPHPARRSFEPVSAVWTCASCRSRVRDTGPFESHPDDRETGHAPGCARHAAEVTAWHRDHDTEQHTDDDTDGDRED